MIRQKVFEEENYTVIFSIKYETNHGQNIYVLGDIKELGSWNEKLVKMTWNKDHMWNVALSLSNDINHFQFKFACLSDDNKYRRWEEGPNRIFDRNSIEGVENVYNLDCMWEQFSITFNIFYPLKNDNEYFQIIGKPRELGQWSKNGGIKMELSEQKTVGNMHGRFWEKTIYFSIKEEENFEFQYKYTIYNSVNKTALWERDPNRQIRILTDYSILSDYDGICPLLQEVDREVELLTNCHINRLDVNFVSQMKLDKIGDFNIFIGPYPQNEADVELLKKNDINAVLNLQTDLDMVNRQINWPLILNAYKSTEIQIVQYPIREFDHEDLMDKLMGAVDELRKLIVNDKIVYVHCTSGMSRAPAIVISYLVYYETFSLESAYDYVKRYSQTICPNITAISDVLK